MKHTLRHYIKVPFINGYEESVNATHAQNALIAWAKRAAPYHGINPYEISFRAETRDYGQYIVLCGIWHSSWGHKKYYRKRRQWVKRCRYIK